MYKIYKKIKMDIIKQPKHIKYELWNLYIIQNKKKKHFFELFRFQKSLQSFSKIENMLTCWVFLQGKM